MSAKLRISAAEIAFIFLIFSGAVFSAAVKAEQICPGDALSWPEVTRESRPWAYWWWMGSAVEKAEITKNLEMYAAAGLGGLHIIPIYGVKGFEERDIEFLSPAWMEMFAFTVSEADRVGLGVDLSTGTGWPMGGPQITRDHAAKTAKIVKRGNEFVAQVKGTGQKVKRAAPGGEGLVLDHFSRDALEVYLPRFDRAFAKTDARPRAFYNDSFEVYGADWTDRMFEEFAKRRGYDLKAHLAALAGQGDKEQAGRVLCDYRETVSDLLLENFTGPWSAWAHGQGAITRDEAHGSPGNLLDLYAAADIPETETFGPSGFDIPGLDYRVLQKTLDRPNPLFMKFASSAGHVAGKPLISSESCTWLGEHFTVTLSQIKPEIDQLWLSGINHVFFHGITYSPTYEDWPGWLFYAETIFGPANTFWRDLPALNRYIAITQAFLQSGKPDNDVLLYWPVHDLWSGVYEEEPRQKLMRQIGDSWKKLMSGRPGEFLLQMESAASAYYESKDSMVQLLACHNVDDWLTNTAFGESAAAMRDAGYSFDYVSDRLLLSAEAVEHRIQTRGASYAAVVVPRCRFMPVETMQKLLELARAGATVIFIHDLPEDVPGLADLQQRRDKMSRLKESLSSSTIAGRVLIGEDLPALLDAAGALMEPIADHGIGFLRRKHDRGRLYFFSNLTSRAWRGWTQLGVNAESAVIFDPLYQKSGLAGLKKSEAGQTQVYLELEPGQSLLLRTFDQERVDGGSWPYLEPATASYEIRGPWRIEFLQGGLEIPEPVTIDELISWTALREEEEKYFSGTARYTVEFNLPGPEKADEWVLDLGEVHESARVMINGREAGVVFCQPFKLRIGEFIRPGVNRLEVEVTNLPVNRIISMDRRHVKWKKFHDTNFVNIEGRRFNAATWKPFPSGLIGPVRLTPRGYK